MVCRRGVRRYLKGGSSRREHSHLLVVYDLEAEDYRSINLETLLEINAQKKRYLVIEGRLVERNSNGI